MVNKKGQLKINGRAVICGYGRMKNCCSVCQKFSVHEYNDAVDGTTKKVAILCDTRVALN